MADIPTPATARKTEELTISQQELVRNSLGIADNPILPDRTYIVFDATSGNNNLHLGVGASGSYTINKGEGGLPINYTDTGGVKVLNYTNAGRYLITISGNFHGIDTNGELQSDKDQYISIVGGTNYVPTTLPVNAFQDCVNLEFFEVQSITVISANVFDGCVLIESIYYPNSTDIGANAFDGCTKLKILKIKTNTTLGTDAFKDVIIVDVFMIGIESLPKFKDQYVSIAGGFYAENARIILDANFNNIRSTPDLINGVTASISIIQSKSFVSPSTSDITNSSSTVFIDTDLIVAITPKTATSKLRVKAQLPFEWDGSVQDGYKLNIYKKVGAGAWTNIVFGNQLNNYVKRITIGVGLTNRRNDVTIGTQIDSPGISDEIQFKVSFVAFTNGQDVIYSDARMRMITVDEIIE